MMDRHLEIERKFLIKMPDVGLINSFENCRSVKISQTYTADRVRIRRWEENEKISYIKTVKEKISEITRVETEGEISKAEYDALIKNADPQRKTINKTRYRFPFKNKLIEIDIFDFWDDRAFLEVELESEDEKFEIPPFIQVIKEVTLDKKYRNSALALQIPSEKI